MAGTPVSINGGHQIGYKSFYQRLHDCISMQAGRKQESTEAIKLRCYPFFKYQWNYKEAATASKKNENKEEIFEIFSFYYFLSEFSPLCVAQQCAFRNICQIYLKNYNSQIDGFATRISCQRLNVSRLSLLPVLEKGKLQIFFKKSCLVCGLISFIM